MNLKYQVKKIVNKFLIIGKMLYHRVPSGFRFIFLPVESIVWLVSVLRLDLWIIEGEEKRSNQKLTMIYLGSEANRNFLIQLAFGNSYSEKHIEKKWLWKIPRIAKDYSQDCSLMIAEVPKTYRRLFAAKKDLFLPSWIHAGIDVSGDNASLLKKNRCFKSDWQKIKNNKLSCEITNDPQRYHDFYYEMYVPYITNSYGNVAFIENYDFMERKFKDCELLLLKNEKECIGGMLLQHLKDEVHLWVLGIKDGNCDYIKDGAIGALFYFAVQYLSEKGYKKMDYGLTRAFLRDGVLQFKKKRGMQIVDTSRMGLLLRPLLKTGGIEGFLLNNPFICMDGKGFNSTIFVNGDQSLTGDDLARLYQDNSLKGISKVSIYRFMKGDEKIPESIPSELADIITVHNADSLF